MQLLLQGLEAAGHELALTVLLALLDPAAQTRWHAGEQVFEPVTAAPLKSRSNAG